MSEAEEVRDRLPGCGLAVYFLLLVALLITGVAGIFFTMSVLHGAGSSTSPLSVTYGGGLPEQWLAPLRKAGVLEKDEVPDVYHPEIYDGSRACAVVGPTLVRVTEETVEKLAIASITRVEEVDGAVVITGGVAIRCAFGEGEGGERFAAMLRAAQRK